MYFSAGALKWFVIDAACVYAAACRRPTSTAVLLPGFFAMKLSANGTITQAQPCPQGYFCPGGIANRTFDPSNLLSMPLDEATIQRCAGGMWTREVGASAADQCCESCCLGRWHCSSCTCASGRTCQRLHITAAAQCHNMFASRRLIESSG